MNATRTYQEVADAARLRPEIAQIYVEYMRARWGDSEALQVETGYATEWAYRFKQGTAWLESDLEGRELLDRLGYDSDLAQLNPPKFERCLEHVRDQGKGYNEYAVCRAALYGKRKMPKKNWPTPDHLVHALQEERAAQRQLDRGDTEGWTFHVGKAAAHRESREPYRNAPRFPENRGKQYFYQCVRPGGQRTIESTTAPLKPHTKAYNRAKKLYRRVVGPFQSRYEALKWR